MYLLGHSPFCPILTEFEKISPLVRSQLTETVATGAARSHSTEELKFLRARDVARECEEARLEITSEQELSDNDQGLEIFPVTSDTIKANGDSDRGDAVWTNQRPVFGSRDLSVLEVNVEHEPLTPMASSSSSTLA